MVARYADYSNVGGDVETVRHEFEVLKRHCERVGWDPEEITFSNDVGILIGREREALGRRVERVEPAWGS